ncbi:TRAP transporter large permease [Desulfatirhabdium butyrativorans]|uniref:TRAP transporter large permease n=1 Tax=Desulfatirhabdium butyrativorans TaxID=340467 RepID=UPI0004850038|nr:TRAP transporter large permease subunit [Desulfatirhabdium butyrativorans]
MVTASIIVGSLLIVLMTGMPVAFALIGLSVILLWQLLGPTALFMLVSASFNQARTEVFIAIPLFVLMASVLQFSGIATSLYNTMRMWTGRLKGGLAIATIIISAILGALSGIGATATVTMGLIALPEMLNKKYNKHLVVGAITAGGALGPLIPPSNLMIIVGGYASLSVGKLFMGGVVPGVLCAVFYSLYIWVRCKTHPEDGPPLPEEEIATLAEKLKALRQVFLPFLLILAVLGGIYGGITTPTEAAGFGAIGAIIIAGIYRQLTFGNLYGALKVSFKVTSMIMWLVIGGGCYSTLVTTTGTAAVVSGFLADIPFGAPGAITVMLLIVLVMGMFIDPVAISMICIPVFLPVLNTFSIDPLWFMLLFTLATCIGYITPPFGLNIFYMKGVVPNDISLGDIYKGVIPYCWVKIAVLILCVLFPSLLTFLPNLMD